MILELERCRYCKQPVTTTAHCESRTCPWVRCPLCKETWKPVYPWQV